MLTTLIATISALCTLAVTMGTAWAKVRPALAPLLRRRRFPIAVVATEEDDREARAFLAQLRSAGYRDVELSRDPVSCLGRRAVVLWQPAPDASQATVDRVGEVAPEATVLIYTHERLPLRLGERLLLANSTLRLRGDLGTLAESAT